MKWISLAAIMLFAVSCSNDSKWNENGYTSVKVNIEADAFGGFGSYKRGTAPAYVSGVDLKIVDNDHSKPDITGTFVFAEDNVGDDIVMNNVVVGSNTFYAVGNTFGEPYKDSVFVDNVVLTDYDNLAQCATDYANFLTSKKPLYADYRGEKTMDIFADPQSNDVTIDMSANNHRMAFVLEDKSVKYNFIIRIYQGSTLIKSFGGPETGALPDGTKIAYVVNDVDAVGTKSYKVEVDYYTSSGVFVQKLTPGPVEVSALQSFTKYYRFTREELLQGDAVFTFNWEEFVSDAAGEEL